VLVFDFDGAISLVNASALALLGLDAPRASRCPHWLRRLRPAGRTRAPQPRPVRQLDALPLGDSRLLTDTDGRRYRGQRGHFYDRGFARHFLMVEELTAELEDSERATYASLIRVLAHEVNNTVAATGSVLDSLLYYRSQLAERDGGDFAPPSSPSSAATSAWANSSTASPAWSRCRRRNCARPPAATSWTTSCG
jgi:two-component system nitrogen regulation sensor histidine kinase NtrY